MREFHYAREVVAAFKGPHARIDLHELRTGYAGPGQTPANGNCYADGTCSHPNQPWLAVGGAGIWFPGRTNTTDPTSAVEEDWSYSSCADQGTRRWAPLRGPHQSSNRSELFGATLALLWRKPIRLMLDSSYVASGFRKMLGRRASTSSKP